MVADTFDLSSLLSESLSLYHNTTPAVKHMFPVDQRDPYEDFIKRDPLEILGERETWLPREIAEQGTPIQEFYRGANVFITGGTGFIGKILIDKLIRSIPNIGQIYLLIRAKKGKTSKERFEQLLEYSVFTRMKAEVPDYKSKITVLEGDLSAARLGLSEEDQQCLIDNINVVFHSAADVRFIEPLKVALASNVVGSKRVLDMAKEMKHLKAYIHVSTAFSQCVRRVVEENVPKMSINYKDILNSVATKSDKEVEEESAKIMQGWPNTYTFSKALCEDMIEEEGRGLPIGIHRPSMVLPTCKEPVRGWTDNVNGPPGLFLAGALGILHSARVNSELPVDNMPCDFVVNSMIAAAWQIGTNRNTEKLMVYNFTSTPIKPVVYKSLMTFGYNYCDLFPYKQAIWHISYFLTTSYLLDRLSYVFLHRIPGAVLDTLTQLTGGKPRLTKLYKHLDKYKEQIDYFLFKVWEFKNENVTNLFQMMSEEDRKEFNFDISNLDYCEHFLIGKLGLRYYILKEDMESIPAAVRKHKWLYWAHKALLAASGYMALKLLANMAYVLPI